MNKRYRIRKNEDGVCLEDLWDIVDTNFPMKNIHGNIILNKDNEPAYYKTEVSVTGFKYAEILYDYLNKRR